VHDYLQRRLGDGQGDPWQALHQGSTTRQRFRAGGGIRPYVPGWGNLPYHAPSGVSEPCGRNPTL